VISWMLLPSLAAATELVPVHPGDTVESLLSDRGIDGDADQVRDDNGLAPGDQPTVGTLLALPDARGVVAQRAFVLTLRGSATVDDAPASLFDQVTEGQTLCTGPDSFATLRLATQCTTAGERADDLTLSADSCVRILGARGSTSHRSTAVRVVRGSVEVQDNPDGIGHVTLQAGDAQTTGAHGGYRVTLEDDEAARTEALYAMVDVQGAGRQVHLDAGQGSRVRRGEAPSPAVQLLPPGTPTLPADGAALRRPAFSWTDAPEAFGYQLQISATPDFVDLVYVDDAPDNTYQPSLLLLPWPDAGRLYWRVSSYDRRGFLGIPSRPRAVRLPAAGATP